MEMTSNFKSNIFIEKKLAAYDIKNEAKKSLILSLAAIVALLAVAVLSSANVFFSMAGTVTASLMFALSALKSYNRIKELNNKYFQ